MSNTVYIAQGSYRNQPVTDVTLPAHGPVKTGARGKFVSVNAVELFGAGHEKIRVRLDEFEEDTTVKATETDEQVMARIEDRFQILDEMTAATVRGNVHAMVVTGPPGVGKSYGVEKELEKGGILDDLAGRRRSYEVVKGAMTPVGLYCKLFEYSNRNDVLVFDDCDSVLFDELSLNILKAALDSGKKRVIHWNADSSKLRNEGVPNKFEFKGSVIFITNLKFDAVRSKKIADHLDALMSRCHYLDLTLDTMRDKFLRIKQIASTGALFQDYRFEQQDEDEILAFMDENRNSLREMSLRMAIKLADLKKMSKDRWQSIAQSTCMKNRS